MGYTYSQYYRKVKEDAKEFADSNFNGFIEAVESGLSISDYLEIDDRMKSWCDDTFDCPHAHDAIDVIEQSNAVEEDFDLWEGHEPLSAIVVQAFHTYKNDMTEYVSEILRNRLHDYTVDFEEKQLEPLREEADNLSDELDSNYSYDKQDRLERISERIDELEETLGYLQNAG